MTTEHPLDNPAWNALRTRQASLAVGEGAALRYDRDYAIFAAARNREAESLAALGVLIRATGPAIVPVAGMLPPVPGTIVAKRREAVQMVAEVPVPPADLCDFVTLGDGDAAEMLALATLTEPGPFFTRTHQLGDFIGMKREGRLIAMAGERMKLTGFTEVSGVCTHPDYRGQGLAGALMQVVAARIVARGETPFLHAYADNLGAIGLYERLGYRLRCAIEILVLEPANGSRES